jgi:hypothetical protein
MNEWWVVKMAPSRSIAGQNILICVGQNAHCVWPVLTFMQLSRVGRFIDKPKPPDFFKNQFNHFYFRQETEKTQKPGEKSEKCLKFGNIEANGSKIMPKNCKIVKHCC